MSFSFRKTACLSLIVAACSAVPVLADPNPAYDGWAKCKPGATTTVKGETSAMGQKTSMTVVTKLLTLTPEKATVEISTAMEMMGNKMPAQTTKQDVPKEITPPKPPAGMKAPEMKKGTETITVLGKSVDCQTTEVNGEQNGVKINAKTWTSSDVPGIVKMTSSTSGTVASTTTMEVVEFKDGN